MRRKDLIAQMRPLLIKRRDALKKLLSQELETISREYDEDVGDPADLALEAEFRETNAQLADAECRELQQIEQALDRLQVGTYGLCEACERTIPMARLQALPYATKCINCQRQSERRGKRLDVHGGVSAQTKGHVPDVELNGLTLS